MAIDMGIEQVQSQRYLPRVKLRSWLVLCLQSTKPIALADHYDLIPTPQYEGEGVVDPLKYMCEMRQDRGGIVQTPVSVRIWCLSLLMLIVAAESPSIVLQYKTYYVYLAHGVPLELGPCFMYTTYCSR